MKLEAVSQSQVSRDLPFGSGKHRWQGTDSGEISRLGLSALQIPPLPERGDKKD